MRHSIKRLLAFMMVFVLCFSNFSFAAEPVSTIPFIAVSNDEECLVTGEESGEFYKTTITKGSGLVLTGRDIEFAEGDGNKLEISAEEIEASICGESDVEYFKELGFTFEEGNEVALFEISYSNADNTHTDCQLIIELLAAEPGPVSGIPFTAVSNDEECLVTGEESGEFYKTTITKGSGLVLTGRDIEFAEGDGNKLEISAEEIEASICGESDVEYFKELGFTFEEGNEVALFEISYSNADNTHTDCQLIIELLAAEPGPVSGIPFTAVSNDEECLVTGEESGEFYKTTITKGSGLVLTGRDIEFAEGDGNKLEISAEEIEASICGESDVEYFKELGFTFEEGNEVALFEISYSNADNTHTDCQLIIELLAAEPGPVSGIPFTAVSNDEECLVTGEESGEFYKTTITKGSGLVLTGRDIEFAEGDGNKLEISAEEIEASICGESDVEYFKELGFTFEEGNEVALFEISYSDADNTHTDCQLIIELLADESGDEDSYEPVIITQPVAETVCDKNDEVVLSIVADETLRHNLSYQWYSNNGNNSVLTMFPIDGATNNTYTVPTGYASTTKYYCIVTNTTADNKTYTTTSDTAVVITNLTSVNDPVVNITSGGDGVYYEYTSPGIFNIIVKATDYIAFDNVIVQLYCNDEDSTVGGEIVWEDNVGQLGSQNAPLDYDTQWTGGANVTEGKPAGTYYYYPKATMTYDGITYTAIGSTKAVTFNAYAGLVDGLEGSGTENEPFLIKSLPDLEYVQSMVNRAGASPETVMPGADGITFEGAFFKMEDDIELPSDWEPIGSLKAYKNDPRNGSDINPFSGTFDGNNHKITVAEGGKPLFGYVRNATIKNLDIYGKKIVGEGLIDNYVIDYGSDGNFNTGVPQTVTIDNVKILSGTKTLGSGLIGGNASAKNIVTITNCVVEKDVVIGYEVDETLGGIGSLAGRFNGTISNCQSAATVNGKDNVGGLVGSKGEAMGPCSITDSSFSGVVMATGEYAGGIIGSGYNSNSAPNAPCVSVENCVVDGSVKGANNVGGILGGEGGVMQAWDNGIGYIRNNEFAGTVEVTNQNGIVGGVIGYMASINKYNVIGNNYYASSCGAENGIGMIKIIDSSCFEQTPSWNDDGTTYYINTAKDDISVIDGVIKELNSSSYSQISRTDSNRNDDPLGEDAEKLCYSDEYVDKQAAKAVDVLIEAIGDPEDVTLESAAAITAAREAYDKLTDAQKALVTKTADLTAAEAKYAELKDAADQAEIDKAAAKGVDDAIGAIDDVTLDSESAITAARAAYDALTDEQKVLVNNLDVLKAAEEKLAQLKEDASAAEAVEDQITAIGEVTRYKKDAIESARAAYDALTDEQKALVNNQDVLEAAEAELDELMNGNGSEDTIRVSFRLIGSTIATEDVDLSKGEEGYYTAEYQNWIKTRTYTMHSDDSVYDLFVKATSDAGIESKGANKGYVSAVKAPDSLGGYWLEEFTNGNYSGWMYTMDGKHANAIKDQKLKDGADVVFHYVNDYRYEVEDWFDEPAYPSAATDGEFYNRWLEAADVRPGSQGGSTPSAPANPAPQPEEQPGGEAAEDRFIDVKPTDWFAGAVDYAVEKGFMAGTGEKTFSPNRTLSRGMLAAMLYSLEGSPEEDGKTAFADVKDNDWFAKGVDWAVENGVAAGYGESFGPNDDITREQMVVMLYGYAKLKGYTLAEGADLSKYADESEISSWAKDAMAWAHAAGLVTGRSADKLAPKGTATRAEAATIMRNFLENVAK